MESDRIAVAPPARARFRWLIHFSIHGDLRFISHHDTLRMFRRALARADLPLRFSEGFNPHPRVNLPLPRPVGISSDAEALLLETDRDVDPSDMLTRLARHMPRGVELRGIAPIATGAPAPEEVAYRIEFDDGAPADLDERVSAFMEAATINVVRKSPKSPNSKTVNVRPFVIAMRTHENAVEFTLRMDGGASARPSEVAIALGLSPEAHFHRIHRLEVRWRS